MIFDFCETCEKSLITKCIFRMGNTIERDIVRRSGITSHTQGESTRSAVHKWPAIVRQNFRGPLQSSTSTPRRWHSCSVIHYFLRRWRVCDYSSGPFFLFTSTAIESAPRTKREIVFLPLRLFPSRWSTKLRAFWLGDFSVVIRYRQAVASVDQRKLIRRVDELMQIS